MFPKVVIKILREFPFPKQIGKNQAGHLISLVDTMLALHKKVPAEMNPQRQEQLLREIGATDRQIDQLVHQLYGRTDDEIRIVDVATAQPTPYTDA